MILDMKRKFCEFLERKKDEMSRQEESDQFWFQFAILTFTALLALYLLKDFKGDFSLDFLFKLFLATSHFFLLLFYTRFVGQVLKVTFFVAFVFLNTPLFISFYFSNAIELLDQGQLLQGAKAFLVPFLAINLIFVMIRGIVMWGEILVYENRDWIQSFKPRICPILFK